MYFTLFGNVCVLLHTVQPVYFEVNYMREIPVRKYIINISGPYSSLVHSKVFALTKVFYEPKIAFFPGKVTFSNIQNSIH